MVTLLRLAGHGVLHAATCTSRWLTLTAVLLPVALACESTEIDRSVVPVTRRGAASKATCAIRRARCASFLPSFA